MTREYRSDTRLYWPQLDGLRFFAALLVFIHHSPRLPGMPAFVKGWGWVGVDLFLVLSAFLLTRQLRAENESSARPNYRHYFLRRACRIWPLHWAFVSAMLIFTIVNSPESLGRSTFAWFSHIAFFNNFLTAINGHHFGQLSFSQHLWTISLEEQYYLMVPFAVPFLVRRPNRITAAYWIGGTLLALWGARAICIWLEVSRTFIWTLPLRMDAMLLGTALGLGLFDRNWIRARPGLCFAAGLGLLYATTGLPPHHQVGWNHISLYPLVDTACVLLVMGSLGSPRIGFFLSTRLLRYLGKISFGIYVYHIIVLHYVKLLAESYGVTDRWIIVASALTATCVIASTSYELFEKHFLKLKRRYTVIESRPL
jgi:peptidoglycan/LPS O-acetylase OafA/YrhL